jgi:cobalt-zinc-cadmium resistance protein CzcA
MPEGYFVTYGGQFENQQRAMKGCVSSSRSFCSSSRSYGSFGVIRQALLVMTNVPFAIVGGSRRCGCAGCT